MEVIAGHKDENSLSDSHRHLPMQSQIALMFMAIMLAFSVFAALLNSWITTNDYEINLNEKAGRYLQMVFNEYVNHQNELRMDVFKNQLNDIVKDQDIETVGLYNNKNEVIIHSGIKVDIPKIIFSSEYKSISSPIIDNNRRYYKLIFPKSFKLDSDVSSDTSHLNSIILGINDDLVFRVAQKAFVWTFLLSMVAAICIMLIAVVVIRKFTYPFDCLSKAMSSAQLGQRGVRVNPGGASEAYQMATSFNAMIAVLERREERLLEQKNVLEKQILVREQTESELKNITYRLQSIFDNVTDGIIVVDKDSRIVSMNVSALTTCEFEESEIIGQDISLIMKSTFIKIAIISLNTKEESDKPDSNETVLICKSEREIPVEVGISLMNFSGHQHYLITIRDITERKNADEKLNDYRLHLETMVFEQTRDIARSRDAAMAGERAMSTFLANMSHELRTPMHGVLSFANIALKKADTVSIAKTKEYLNEIKASGNNLLDIINDLLDLSKMKSGKMEYQYSSILFGHLVENVARQMSMLAKKENVLFDIKVLGEEKCFDMDEMRMTQVLRNLYANAIKFADSDTEIKITLDYKNEDRLIFSVFNKGVCVPQGEGDLIFQSFAQSSNTKNNAGGTGLGLPICKEIVESGHKGKIYVDTNIDDGAKFIVDIPFVSRDCGAEFVKEVHHS